MKNALRRILSLLICVIMILTVLTSFAAVEPYRERAEYKDYIDFSPYISKSHPRLYISSFENLKTEYMADPITAEWYGELIKAADNIVDNIAPGEGMNFDTVKLSASTKGDRVIASQATLLRVYTLAFAAGCEQDRKYADRLWEEVALIVALPGWNPQHWLEMAEMIHCVAIAYDWCYNFWTEEQKTAMKDAVVKKGLARAVREYNNYPTWYKWFKGLDGYTEGHNWSTVCNTGILFGALVFYDDTEYEVTYNSSTKTYTYNWNMNDMINNAIRAIRAGLRAYDEDGSYEESFAYWRYATENLVMNVSGFENAIGGDLSVIEGLPEPFFMDLSLAPGVSTTPDYPIYANGPAGVFCFGDTSRGSVTISPAMMWIGNRFGVPHYKKYHLDMIEKFGIEGRNIPHHLLWYGDGEAEEKELPLDRLFEDDFVVLKDKWDDDALYFALKGGLNGRPHQHWDIGTFIFDVFGKRYGMILGASNYKWTGTSSHYYLVRPEGQNTIVINPDEYIGQDPEGVSTFETFYTGVSNAYAILDMTGAYARKSVGDGVYEDTGVISARRGVKMFKDKTRIILQDEVKTENPSDVYWFMHTEASIGFRNDNKTAVLTQGGKTVYLNLVSNADVKFEKMDASRLETSPERPSDQPKSYGHKLAIVAKGVTDYKLAVEFIPIQSTVPKFTAEIEPLDQWHPEKDVIVNGKNATVYGTDKKGRTVTMVTTSPSGAVCATGEQVVGDSGEYTFNINLRDEYENGTYTVKINGSVYKTFTLTGGADPYLAGGKPEFSCGGYLTAGKITYTVPVKNEGRYDEDALCYVIVKKGKRVIDIKAATETITAYQTENITGEIMVPSPASDYTVNVFVWYKDKPLESTAKKYVFDADGGRYE